MLDRRPDARVAASRAAIMSAATELVAEKGLAGVTIDDVLTRSRVARATLYRHWPNRRALIMDVLAELMTPPTIKPGSGAGDLRQRLTAYVNRIADEFEHNPMASVMPSLLEVARRDPELAQRLPAFHEARRAPFDEIVRAAKDSGEIEQDLDTDTAMAEIVGPLYFRRHILGDSLDQPLKDSVVRDFLTAHHTNAIDGRPRH